MVNISATYFNEKSSFKNTISKDCCILCYNPTSYVFSCILPLRSCRQVEVVGPCPVSSPLHLESPALLDKTSDSTMHPDE